MLKLIKFLVGRDILVDKSKKKKEKSNDSDDKNLSTAQILKEIGVAVNREKTKRESAKKKSLGNAYKLGSELLVKGGKVQFEAPMSQDLATLKAFIETIVRNEIRKNRAD
ncbi:MAG: hypothetical protein CML40_06725 [Rhodobacteraceae bacterium]|nr:MAG: hypothetical protein CML40_06725 [Paracoccaceae bacterium]